MSLRLIDYNRAPSTPKSWSVPAEGKNIRVSWDSSRTPWNTFYSQVKRVHSDNNLPEPTMEEVENHICQQLPSGWCAGSQTYRAPAPKTSGGCKACGRRR